MTFQYVSGNQLSTADALSIAYPPDPGMGMTYSIVRHPGQDMTGVHKATDKSPLLQTPSSHRGRMASQEMYLPEPIRLNFYIRDTLSHQDRIILKVENS